MRTLYISRHAEAEHSFDTDFSRCLTSCGKEEAGWLGKYLLKHDIIIDAVLSSPAQRALNTAKIIIQQVHLPSEKLLSFPELYHADLLTLLQFIRSLDNQHQHLLLVAHNPGLSDLVHYLIDTDVGHLPTCGFCGLDLDIDSWSQLERGIGKLRLISYPGAE